MVGGQYEEMKGTMRQAELPGEVAQEGRPACLAALKPEDNLTVVWMTQTQSKTRNNARPAHSHFENFTATIAKKNNKNILYTSCNTRNLDLLCIGCLF